MVGKLSVAPWLPSCSSTNVHSPQLPADGFGILELRHSLIDNCRRLPRCNVCGHPCTSNAWGQGFAALATGPLKACRSLEISCLSTLLDSPILYLFAGVHKWGYTPKSSHFNRIFPYKPSILGYHHFKTLPIPFCVLFVDCW